MTTAMLSTYGSDRAYWGAVADAARRSLEREEWLRASRANERWTNYSDMDADGAGRTFKRTIRCQRSYGGGPCKLRLTINHKREGEAAGWVYFSAHWYCPVHKKNQGWYGGK